MPTWEDWHLGYPTLSQPAIDGQREVVLQQLHMKPGICYIDFSVVYMDE
jgi:hypothetical protein